jgi:protein SCO1/2
MTAPGTRMILLAAAFAAGLAAVLAVVLLVTDRVPVPVATTASAVGGPFRLVDQNGRPRTEEDLKGHPFLVFFGFTHCPDVCPTTLFEVSEVLRNLGPDAGGARALFITVDPERDTPEKLKDYLSSFDPHLIGLTGAPAAIERVLKGYRVYYRKVPAEGGGYTMDHTALVYLMDKQGRFVAPFNLKRRAEEAAADLRRHL